MKIKEFAQPVKREETIQPEESYELLGIRLNGNGLYVRERKKGSEIATKTLNKVQEGDFIYSRLFGWRGAFGIVPEKFDGLYVSNEFPTFEIDKSKVNKEFLLRYFLLSKTLHEVESYCIGTTKQSRNRFKEPYFLDMEVEFPRIEEQDRLNDRLANTENHVFQIKSKGEENERLIKQLRQTILQEAIQGKLTKAWREANPDIEQADQLLARIQKEKERLIREEQIKKEKPLPPVTKEEKPFSLPEGWVWCRLGEILKKCDYGTSKKCGYNGNVPVFSMNNVSQRKVVKTNNMKKLPHDSGSLPKLYLENKDILFNRTNSYELVGKSGIFEGENDKFSFASYLIRLRILDAYPEYVILCLNSTFFRKSQIEPRVTQQTGQANFNGTKLKKSLIPLPSKQEQFAIIEKVNQLMTYCNELETQVKQSQTHAEQLMKAVLQEVFEGEAKEKELSTIQF